MSAFRSRPSPSYVAADTSVTNSRTDEIVSSGNAEISVGVRERIGGAVLMPATFVVSCAALRAIDHVAIAGRYAAGGAGTVGGSRTIGDYTLVDREQFALA